MVNESTELCENRRGRPEIPSLIIRTVSVDVKQRLKKTEEEGVQQRVTIPHFAILLIVRIVSRCTSTGLLVLQKHEAEQQTG